LPLANAASGIVIVSKLNQAAQAHFVGGGKFAPRRKIKTEAAGWTRFHDRSPLARQPERT